MEIRVSCLVSFARSFPVPETFDAELLTSSPSVWQPPTVVPISVADFFLGLFFIFSDLILEDSDFPCFFAMAEAFIFFEPRRERMIRRMRRITKMTSKTIKEMKHQRQSSMKEQPFLSLPSESASLLLPPADP